MTDIITSPTQVLKVADIKPSRRPPLRAINPDAVAGLKDSMQKVGQLQPIMVEEMPDGSKHLVFGRHRLEALKALGWADVRADVVSPDDADQSRLSEIDENLMRAELDDAERAAHTRERERLFRKALNVAAGLPEDASEKEYAAKKSAEVRTAKAKGLAAPESRAAKKGAFAEDTAKKTGQSAAKVQKDVARGKGLENVDGEGGNASVLSGTQLAKGEEMDALVKLKQVAPERAKEVVKAAKAGDKKASARKTLAEVAPEKAKKPKKEKAPPTGDEGKTIESEEAKHGQNPVVKDVSDTAERRSVNPGPPPYDPIRELREILSHKEAANWFILIRRSLGLVRWAIHEGDAGQRGMLQYEIDKLLKGAGILERFEPKKDSVTKKQGDD